MITFSLVLSPEDYSPPVFWYSLSETDSSPWLLDSSKLLSVFATSSSSTFSCMMKSSYCSFTFEIMADCGMTMRGFFLGVCLARATTLAKMGYSSLSLARTECDSEDIAAFCSSTTSRFSTSTTSSGSTLYESLDLSPACSYCFSCITLPS